MSAKAKKRELVVQAPRIVGDVVVGSLTKVKPNGWNMNAPTPFELQVIESGLATDGWLKSQSLLVWGKDERGKVRNLIIDGEQRWTVAQRIGFVEAPMVFLDGLTLKQAKALTIKFIYHRARGEPNREKLSDVLKTLEIPDLEFASLDLGIVTEDLDRLMRMTTGTFLDDLAQTPTPDVKPVSYKITFDFSKEEDKIRVLEVLDRIDKKNRAAALLVLCEGAVEV